MDTNPWADQPENKVDGHHAEPIPPPCEKKKLGDGGNRSKYSKKMEDGLDKTKVAASNGMRKVKTGAVLSARWIKDKCHRTNQKD